MSPSPHESRLAHLTDIIESGLTAESTAEVMSILGANPLEVEELEKLKLYSETLPMAEMHPYTPEVRFMHFLWDLFDKLPLCLHVPFSIPFRRLLAENMFASCGKAFVCEENVRFNFPQNLTIGE